MKNNKGITFVVALIVVGIMCANLLLFSTMVMRNAFEARKEVNSIAALYVADAGANMALRELQKGGDGDIGETAFGDGTYEFETSYDIAASGWVITSTGIVKGQKRVVRLNISTPPKVAFEYGVFTDGIQEYSGGGAEEYIVVSGDVHSNTVDPHINNDNHDIVDGEHEIDPVSDYGFPELDIDGYYRAEAQSVGDNYYYTDEYGTLGNALNSLVVSQSGGVTLVELTGVDAGEDVSIKTDGQGIVIVIGGNVDMSGNNTFTGLIYVNMNENGTGGNVRIGGNYKVIGGVVSRTANTIHGTNTVTYSETDINIEGLQVDTDKITVLSWQSS